MNLGYYPSCSDQDLATLAAGTPDELLAGAGAMSLRPSLPESFLEEYGYAARVAAFGYYDSIGTREHTLIVGYPSAAHRMRNALHVAM